MERAGSEKEHPQSLSLKTMNNSNKKATCSNSGINRADCSSTLLSGGSREPVALFYHPVMHTKIFVE